VRPPAPDRPPLAPRLPAGLTPLDASPAHDLTWEDAEVTGDLTAHRGDELDVSACRLRGGRLAGAAVERVRMTDVVLEGCDLAGVVLGGASLARVDLRDCRLVDVRFLACRLDGANLRMVTGQHVAFEDCSLAGADLGGAALARARFFDCDLTGVERPGADLGGARLHGSTVDSVSGAGARRGVIIDSGQMVPISLLALAALGIRIDDDRGAGESEADRSHP